MAHVKGDKGSIATDARIRSLPKLVRNTPVRELCLQNKPRRNRVCKVDATYFHNQLQELQQV
eukprot:snap_masked-scaffold_1-processed-gene-24.26-mRNA-1 protein AED:1.00 eAED:1.00 QI:0/0/0/0/1/1/2/0/61